MKFFKLLNPFFIMLAATLMLAPMAYAKSPAKEAVVAQAAEAEVTAPDANENPAGKGESESAKTEKKEGQKIAPAPDADKAKGPDAKEVDDSVPANPEAKPADETTKTTGGLIEHLPHEAQTGMVTPKSPVMERINHFHNQLLVLITVISLFVLGLMVYVCVRFSEKNNPVPSKVTHNNTIEVLWTLVPALILIVVGWVSWHHLYYIDDGRNDADMTIKVVGYQWYWNYEYPDHGGFVFDSYMIKDDDANKPANYRRLLTADNAVVVPVNTKVRVQVTAGDVIHAFALPSFGVKIDAVPGQLNETWFEATEVGMYYGQCSELCGVGHGFMPINILVVTAEEFAAWVEQAKVKFAANGNQPLTFAEMK